MSGTAYDRARDETEAELRRDLSDLRQAVQPLIAALKAALTRFDEIDLASPAGQQVRAALAVASGTPHTPSRPVMNSPAEMPRQETGPTRLDGQRTTTPRSDGWTGMSSWPEARPVTATAHRDLIAALAEMLREFGVDGHGNEFENGECLVVDRARAALAKAQGIEP